MLGNMRLASGGELKRARKRVTSVKKAAGRDSRCRLSDRQPPGARRMPTLMSRARKNTIEMACSAPNDSGPCPLRADSIIGCNA